MAELDALIKVVFMSFKVSEAKGNQLATISVYLNTPIIAVLLAVGFLLGSVLFAGILLIAK
ncbi:hypothetical protein [Prochlorococcus sp. MIT 0916]|uniref:hypothetical protein n=1 Tax=Prochlorococcus sp. MIT 0916 TaxID=3082521 RepID=UPI0039B5AEA5